MTTVLKTKLHIPPIKPNVVPRPRLIDRLNDGLCHRFTLVSAPAGFGKTTLLSQWAQSCNRPVAWLSNDKADNNTTRFWSHIIAALQTVSADIGAAVLAALQSPQPPPIESLVTDLLNEITEIPQSLILVLDDYHIITAPQIHQAITFFLDNAPSQIHLVVASRADPPWPMARLRAHREIAELRTHDLRFTAEESAAFLNDVMRLGLSPKDIVALDTHTEGWIVGLQMAALSMQGQGDPSAFVSAFSGSHRFVLDYLVEEVLDRQTKDIQAFLLETAILERLSAPLCDAITGRKDSQIVLTQLEQANLFVVPLDHERCWYRYHHLFADLMRRRMAQIDPDRVQTLHRRASEWHEMNGFTAEAVRHAWAADDIARTAHLVKENVLAMMDYGELTTLSGWLGALPDRMLHHHPWLSLAYAWALTYSGQLETVAQTLHTTEESLADRPPAGSHSLSHGELDHIAGHIAAIRAYMAVLDEDYASAASFARRSLRLLPKEDLTARGFVAAQLGIALRTTNGLVAATEATIEASVVSQAAGDTHVAVMALADLAGLQRLQGRLQEAAATCQNALQLAQEYANRSGHHLPITGYVYGRLSTILFQQNDLDTAVRLAREGVALCRRWGQREFYVDCCLFLAVALQALGDDQGALDAIQEARRTAQGWSTYYESTVNVFEVWIRLAQGDLTYPSQWATDQESGLNLGKVPDSQHAFRYLTLVQVLNAQVWSQTDQGRMPIDRILETKLQKATLPLAKLLQAAKTEHQIMRAIEVPIIQALVAQGLGKMEQALSALEDAISLAKPGGFVQIFTSKGDPMAKLLQQALARNVETAYTHRLLSALGRQATGIHAITAHIPSYDNPPLVEPLTRRELEVLRLLATGFSNKEIAQALVITAGTVKTHLHNIYGKLGVRSRTQATARALELGLL